MKRVVSSLLLFFFTTLFMLSATVCVCVVPVVAEVINNYYKIPHYANNGYAVCEKIENGTYAQIWVRNQSDNDLRFVDISYNGQLYWYVVSRSQYNNNYVYVKSDNLQSIGSYSLNSSVNVDGVTYYYFYQYVDGDSLNYRNAYHAYNSSLGNVTRNAIYWTFGAGATTETTDWGNVDVEGYQTNIAGQGQASINNVDVITWNSGTDTNGNDISDGNVRIRFIPGEYKSSLKNDLLTQTYNDFILDVVHATDGNVFPVSDGSASFKWSDVIDTLNIPFVSIYSLLFENDAWLKRGWIYEIRLEIDDYIGEWQPIYASTSSGVENDLTIVNTSVISQNTITTIQQINSINSTANIWIVNGQPVDPNPEQEPPASENEKPWWVYLLEMINNTLGIQNEYINEGTDESIEVVNNFEGDHTELNTTVEDYDDIENDLVLDMNNNLEQIEVESDLIENNSFLSSARWVAEQYTTIITDNPIGSILKFSLVLGFVMIFLGRFK